METKQVSMSAEELAQFEAFKKQQEKEAAAKRRKENREAYAQLVDEEIDAALPELKDLSQQIAAVDVERLGDLLQRELLQAVRLDVGLRRLNKRVAGTLLHPPAHQIPSMTQGNHHSYTTLIYVSIL